jgi:hypothetical protein
VFYFHVFKINIMLLLTVFKDGTGNGCAKHVGTQITSQMCCLLFNEVLLAKLKALPSECLLFAPDPHNCRNCRDTLHPITFWHRSFTFKF